MDVKGRETIEDAEILIIVIIEIIETVIEIVTLAVSEETIIGNITKHQGTTFVVIEAVLRLLIAHVDISLHQLK